MRINKPNFWKSKNLISVLLFPFSLIVIMVTFFKNRFIKPTKFKIPIICVGNIYLGGTGKTPLSIFLAKEFEIRGKNPVIVVVLQNHYDEHCLLKINLKTLF